MGIGDVEQVDVGCEAMGPPEFLREAMGRAVGGAITLTNFRIEATMKQEMADGVFSTLQVFTICATVLAVIALLGVGVTSANQNHMRRYLTCVESGGTWVANPEICIVVGVKK